MIQNTDLRELLIQLAAGWDKGRAEQSPHAIFLWKIFLRNKKQILNLLAAENWVISAIETSWGKLIGEGAGRTYRFGAYVAGKSWTIIPSGHISSPFLVHLATLMRVWFLPFRCTDPISALRDLSLPFQRITKIKKIHLWFLILYFFSR